MIRSLLVVLASVMLLGAARTPEVVAYRLGVEPQAGRTPLLTVEIRLRGDTDGETRIDLPDSFASGREAWRNVEGFTAKGASVMASAPAQRVLRHRPGARLTIRYRVRSAYDQDPQASERNPYRGAVIRPDWFAALGEFVFATPAGREGDAATLDLNRPPAGWQVASSVERGHVAPGLTANDVAGSITMGSLHLDVAQRPISGGSLRVATLAGGTLKLDGLADEIAGIVSAQRGFWNDLAQPYFVAVIPLAGSGGSALGGTNRTGGFALYVTPGGEDRLGRVIAHEHTHTWIPFRTGRMPTKDETGVYWFSEGFTDFFMNRTLLRAGLEPPQTTVARMDEALRAYDASPFRTAPGSRIVADVWSDPVLRKLPYQRGALLALKWDEEIRRKSGGKLDMDDVILRMADHYRRFPAGQGPDVVTGLVSAAWVTAGLDLRPDIARYADGGAVVPLPETMFDGCLDARITVSPGFDAGFDATGSFAAKVVRGVRRGGPAWNSGLRNGMALESWVFNAGDMTREIVLAVRATGKRARPRTIRFWPYGDVDVETRRLQMAVGLSETASAACARKIGGL